MPLTAIAKMLALVAAFPVGAYALSLFIPQLDVWLFRARRKLGRRHTVALTFDDGPDNPWTSHILDILSAEGIKASFFVLGGKAARRQGLVQRMIREGHDVGNHTTSHGIMTFRRRARNLKEIEETNSILSSITGARPVLFRAPHGFKYPLMRRTLKRLGLRLIPWTKGIWDTDGSGPEVLLGRFRKRFRDVEILLLHDGSDDGIHGRGPTVAILPEIIAEYRRRGYRFIKISDIDIQTGTETAP